MKVTIGNDGHERRTFTGYDGHNYSVGDRVELHPACDLWMRGARFGTVVGSSLTSADRVRVKLDRIAGERIVAGSEDTFRFIGKGQA